MTVEQVARPGCDLLALEYTEPSLFDGGERAVMSVYNAVGAKIADVVFELDQVRALLQPLFDERAASEAARSTVP